MKALEPFFDVLLHNWPGLAGFLGIFVLFKILASPTFKGWLVRKNAARSSIKN
jgi:hypothetical protein